MDKEIFPWKEEEHPSLKLGGSLSVRVRGNGQCYAQFDSKADRVTQMGTNSD